MPAKKTRLTREQLVASLEANKESLVTAFVAKVGAQALFRLAGPMEITVVVPSGEDLPWIDFAVDEARAGRIFRVVHSIFVSAAGRATQLFCSSPAGLAHDSYGLKVGEPRKRSA